MASKFRLSPAQKILPVAVIFIFLAIFGYLYFFSKGTLQIEPTPKDSAVFINGNQANKESKLSPGNYLVKVAKDGYVAFFRELKITMGTTKKISPLLKKLPEPKQIASNVNYITRFNDSIYYISNNSLFKKDGGKEQQITPDKFANTNKILFLPDEQNCLVLKNGNLFFYEFKRYDLVNQVETQILSNVGDFALTSDGNRIAYTYFPDGGQRLIQIANKNGSDNKIIFNLKDINFSKPNIIFTPDNNNLLISEKDLYILDLSNGKIKKLAENISKVIPSPESQLILAGDQDNNLKIIKFDGEFVYNLNAKTPISKTSWISNDNKLVFYMDNNLYLVDLTQSKIIPYQTVKLEGIDRILSASSEKVYFIKSNNLYEIQTITGWE